MVIYIQKEIGGFDFAGMRDSGEGIRETIKNSIEAGDTVTLDFLGINGISHGFADEIVGIIVRAFGIEFIKDKISLNNANGSVKNMLNLAIGESKKIRA